MKWCVAVVLGGALACSVVSAEYEELTELKVSSAQMLGQYAGRLVAVDPKVLDNLTVLVKKVVPFVMGKQRTLEGLTAFAEGCEAMELYPFAAHARWVLTRVDLDHMQQHLKVFLDLIEKCGCEDAEFFRNQFQFDESILIESADNV